MPYLGDYIGLLLSEITIARMQADLEAVRVAELYANHPLLRHMPVPRFRLPDINIDVPLAIKKMEETKAGEPPRGAPTLDVLRKTFDKIFINTFNKEGVTLKPEDKSQIKSALDQKMDSLAQPAEIAGDVHRIADEMVSAVSLTLMDSRRPGGPIEEERVKDIQLKLKKMARLEFTKLRKAPPRLHALVTTAEIREAGPSEILTHLQLKISEEAVEWASIESEGQMKDKLVQE